nr:hypothetical protein [Streptomyces pactum]
MPHARGDARATEAQFDDETMVEPDIRTARTEGLPRRTTVVKHGLGPT